MLLTNFRVHLCCGFAHILICTPVRFTQSVSAAAHYAVSLSGWLFRAGAMYAAYFCAYSPVTISIDRSTKIMVSGQHGIELRNSYRTVEQGRHHGNHHKTVDRILMTGEGATASSKY